MPLKVYCTAALTSPSDCINLHNIFIFGMAYCLIWEFSLSLSCLSVFASVIEFRCFDSSQLNFRSLETLGFSIRIEQSEGTGKQGCKSYQLSSLFAASAWSIFGCFKLC